MLLFFLLLTLFSCDDSREATAKRGRDLKIGVAWSGNEGLFIEGVSLALSEINNSLPNGNTLSLDIRNDGGSVNLGLINASKFAEDPTIIAVIGHSESYISIPASSIYEYNNILMVNPFSTSTDLTRNGYDYLLRVIPDNGEIAEELLDYFSKENLKRVHICYVSDSYGKNFANSFERSAEAKGIDIGDRASYDVGDVREFNRLLARWENYNYDAIMFVGFPEEGLNFYRVLKSRGVDVPVIVSESMLSDEVVNEEILDGMVIPAIYHSDDKRYVARTFFNKFKKRYNKTPDLYAALGYDSVHLIAKGIVESKSFIPKSIVDRIKVLKNYQGVVNQYNFNRSGNLILQGRIGMQKLEDGEYKYLGRY